MSFEKKYYIKYPLNYNLLLNILNENKKEKVNFFIDLNSICKGFYKAETILFEIGEYAEKGNVSGKLIYELKDFLNNLYKIFRSYDPFFVIFYDDGKCIQNRTLMPTYKSGRSINNIPIENDEKVVHLFRKIKKWYYAKIKDEFEKPNLSSVQYLKDYETDLVAYYCIKYNIFDSSEDNIMNIILSVDKDLLQTLQFPNTLMLPTSFKANRTLGKYELDLQIYDNKTAIKYIYDKFNPGILTSKYIPLILSLAGDKSDEILGLSGIGVGKAVKMIEKNNIPYTVDGLKNNLKSLPDIIQKNIDIVIRNMKLISFEEQIKRLPKEFLQ